MKIEMLPTMIEASNLTQLQEIQEAYNQGRKNSYMPSNVSFMVLRSKENDFLAYFHDSTKNPTIKETVKWMSETDNLTFPGNVSISRGVKARYDDKFHQELDGAIKEVMDEFINFNRSEFVNKLMDNPELLNLLEDLIKDIPQPPKVTIK